MSTERIVVDICFYAASNYLSISVYIMCELLSWEAGNHDEKIWLNIYEKIVILDRGSGRSSSGQAAQLHRGSQHLMSCRHPASTLPPTKVPKRMVSSAEEVVKEEPKRTSAWLSVKPAAAKVEMKPKKKTGDNKSSDKKVQTKGKKNGAKGKQGDMANQETKDQPAENGDLKTEESPAFDEIREKEAKSH
ncbi:non-histone chromosomal protein HMG-14-like [Symphalangus syndactylus]|uniref:non-histone chromosomal protein HMG-14-like n=1 Tax=Symphalangus syndactylus TaxID=9590 RepID=UPI003005CD21